MDAEDQIECLFVTFQLVWLVDDRWSDMQSGELGFAVQSVDKTEQRVKTIDGRVTPMRVGSREERKWGGVSHLDKPIRHIDEGEARLCHAMREILIYVDCGGVGIAVREVFRIDFGFVRCDKSQKLNAVVF